MPVLHIKNARVIDPASKTDKVMDLVCKDGKILLMGENLMYTPEYKKIPRHELQMIDAEGLVAAPGLVDTHVHFRDPGFPDKEDIYTGAAAAAAGGYTSVVMMANTNPAADSPETLTYMLEKGKETPVHVYACSTVTKQMAGRELADLEALKEVGAVGFTDDGKPILDEGLVRRGMERAAALGMPVSFHEEDPAYIFENGINAGPVAEKLGLKGSHRNAEITMVERDLKLAKETGACVVIQHISAAETVELIRKAKAEGVNVHGEATPHHFSLTEEAVLTYGTYAKMNPPLRTEVDRTAIIEGLADGTLDLIATDHAPHTKAEKEKPFAQAPSGIIGLETALALGIKHLVKPGKLTLSQLIEKMSLNPATLYGLPAGKLEVGGPADLVLFDPRAGHVPSAFKSKAENTPFTGTHMPARVEFTICGGRVAYVRTVGFDNPYNETNL